MSKIIKLTKGYETTVDDDWYEILSSYQWVAIMGRHGQSPYVRSRGRKYVIMHRLIMDAPIDSQVDHINGNTLDNRKSNLRICTPSQNCMNRNKKKNSHSSYKGVHQRCDNGRWRAHIAFNKKRTWIGHFNSEIEAAIAYNEAAKKYHGEFAKLNDI